MCVSALVSLWQEDSLQGTLSRPLLQFPLTLGLCSWQTLPWDYFPLARNPGVGTRLILRSQIPQYQFGFEWVERDNLRDDLPSGKTDASLYLSQPTVAVFPSAVNFGSEKVGQTSPPASVQISNI